MGELTGYSLAQFAQQCLEQSEAFCLVFIQRITLAITAQSDDLPEMLQCHQMFAPQVIERLQEDSLLHLPHGVRAEL